MDYKFEVVWGKKGGRYTERMEFINRGRAVLYLNYLILDCGESDAKLRPLTLTYSPFDVLEA